MRQLSPSDFTSHNIEEVWTRYPHTDADPVKILAEYVSMLHEKVCSAESHAFVAEIVTLREKMGGIEEELGNAEEIENLECQLECQTEKTSNLAEKVKDLEARRSDESVRMDALERTFNAQFLQHKETNAEAVMATSIKFAKRLDPVENLALKLKDKIDEAEVDRENIQIKVQSIETIVQNFHSKMSEEQLQRDQVLLSQTMDEIVVEFAQNQEQIKQQQEQIQALQNLVKKLEDRFPVTTSDNVAASAPNEESAQETDTTGASASVETGSSADKNSSPDDLEEFFLVEAPPIAKEKITTEYFEIHSDRTSDMWVCGEVDEERSPDRVASEPGSLMSQETGKSVGESDASYEKFVVEHLGELSCSMTDFNSNDAH